jgi:hypothetical protein
MYIIEVEIIMEIDLTFASDCRVRVIIFERKSGGNDSSSIYVLSSPDLQIISQGTVKD